MADTYIDFNAASDGVGSYADPRNRWPSDLALTANELHRVYLRQGSRGQIGRNYNTVGQYITATTGFELYGYNGGTAGPNPVLLPNGAYSMATLSTSGVFKVVGVNFPWDDTQATALLIARRGVTVTVTDCSINIRNYDVVGANGNAIMAGGSNGRIANNQINARGNGVYFGESSFAAGSNNVIEDNTIFSFDQDAITMHDGTGLGTGNIVRRNTCSTDTTNGEEGVDIQPPYSADVYDNTVTAAGQSGIAYDGGAAGNVYGNHIYGCMKPGLRIYEANSVVRNNYVHDCLVNGDASCLMLMTGATGIDVSHNTFRAAAGTVRRIIYLQTGTTMNFYGNAVENLANQRTIDCADATVVSGSTWYLNAYYQPNRDATGGFWDGASELTFASWQAAGRDSLSLKQAMTFDTLGRMARGHALINFGARVLRSRDILGGTLNPGQARLRLDR